MCGRFAQFSSRDEYLQFLNISGDTVLYDPQPLDRYNVVPGTRVLILSEREGNCSLDPVVWGYCPEWWRRPPLINARSETASTGKMFSNLWRTGRAIVPAMSGKSPVPVNSLITSTVQTAARCLWPRLDTRPLIQISVMKVLSLRRHPVTRAWLISRSATARI